MDLKQGEYTEVYRKYFKNKTRSNWRMMQAFLGGYWWYKQAGKSKTPPELLEEIYDLGLQLKVLKTNLDELRQRALMKVAEITKRESAVSR